MASIRVESYAELSGSRYPLRFKLGWNVFVVEELLDRWYEVDSFYFKIRADDRNIYILKHVPLPQADRWELTSFRRADDAVSKELVRQKSGRPRSVRLHGDNNS